MTKGLTPGAVCGARQRGRASQVFVCAAAAGIIGAAMDNAGEREAPPCSQSPLLPRTSTIILIVVIPHVYICYMYIYTFLGVCEVLCGGGYSYMLVQLLNLSHNGICAGKVLLQRQQGGPKPRATVRNGARRNQKPVL